MAGHSRLLNIEDWCSRNELLLTIMEESQLHTLATVKKKEVRNDRVCMCISCDPVSDKDTSNGKYITVINK